MRIVITTPTGHIGSATAARLLDAGEDVVLVARDRSKVSAFASRGATVVEGSHGDADLLARAAKGADALLLVTPPDMRTSDLRAHYRRFGRAAVEAVAESRVPRVVHLSSVGADLDGGTGPVAGLHDIEELLAGTSAHVTNLRPSYFMENTLGQIPSIKAAGSLFTTFKAGTRFPMIATRDIAERAAALLRDRSWTGKRVVELQGAGETGYDEAAAVLTEVLGRPIRHVTVAPEQAVAALGSMGVSAHLAGLFNELAEAIQQGRVRFHEPRSAANTTPTTYPLFAQQVFKPAFDAS